MRVLLTYVSLSFQLHTFFHTVSQTHTHTHTVSIALSNRQIDTHTLPIGQTRTYTHSQR